MGEYKMPELLFGNWDSNLKEIADALSGYEVANPDAHVSLYRQNSASVRIRVIDPAFAGHGIGERGKMVWPYLRPLSEDARSEITLLLTLTPDEAPSSFANADFDRPIPSAL
jgi:hypothetical protein